MEGVFIQQAKVIMRGLGGRRLVEHSASNIAFILINICSCSLCSRLQVMHLKIDSAYRGEISHMM